MLGGVRQCRRPGRPAERRLSNDGQRSMTEQRANSDSPLAGLAPASAAQADVAPPIAAPTSDAAADAAAWARIDRALQSTRKWLWVFVVASCLFSAYAIAIVFALASLQSTDTAQVRITEQLFRYSASAVLVGWGLASAWCAWALTRRAMRRLPGHSFTVVHRVFDLERSIWMFSTLALTLGAIFTVIASVAILLEDALNV